MKKQHTIILITLLLFIPLSYILYKKEEPKKVIKIPQLSIQSAKEKSVISENPLTILSNLKVAVETAKEKTIPSKKEEALQILATLKESTKTLKKIKEEKKVIAKEVIVEKVVLKKKIIKKVVHKKNTPKKVIPKKKMTHECLEKKVLPKESKLQKTKIKTVETPKKPLSKRLSREEEVALYKKQHQHGLEVVEESSTFVLNEEKNSLPDAHYFDPIQTKKNNTKNEPIGFVKTLGVVEVSKQYEVGNVEIDKKIELAKEGVVNVSSATVETDDLKSLKFVEPLEVIEVSPAFETIDAKEYIK